MRRRFSILGLLMLIAAPAVLPACGGAIRYTPVPQIMREADPVIIADIKKDLGLTMLEIRIEHLGAPDRVNPNLLFYVVWARRNATLPWQRQGALAYSKDGHVGELKSQIGETRFELIITAEASNQPPEPTTSNAIVSQQVGSAE